jgi:DNA-binding CsgD family transcriptional regulator
MLRRRRLGESSTVPPDVISAEPLFLVDEELRVTAWNAPMEQLTGTPARQAVGQFCWEALRAHGADGSIVCHPGCSGARLARSGIPVERRVLSIRTSAGRRDVSVSTLSIASGAVRSFAHVCGPPVPQANGSPPHLTPRQLEVLRLLADGTRPRQAAEVLGITVPTVYNHLRAAYLELGAHSQLDAVARARRAGVI